MKTPRLPFRSNRTERPRQTVPDVHRGIVGALDWRFRRVRWTVRAIHAFTLAFLLVAGLGPLLWLAKSAITPTVASCIPSTLAGRLSNPPGSKICGQGSGFSPK